MTSEFVPFIIKHNTQQLSELRVLLSCQPLSWLQKFIAIDGIVLLVNMLGTVEKKAIHNSSEESRYRHSQDDLIMEAECIRCLRMLMNNEVGLRAVLHTKDAIKNLCLALDSAGMDPKLKGVVLKLLTVTVTTTSIRRLYECVFSWNVLRVYNV